MILSQPATNSPQIAKIRALPRPERRIADQLVTSLIEQGIDRVYGIPGGTICPIFDSLADTDIDVTICQHESMAVYLAYGYARATGRPGCVLVTSGPGILNAFTGIAAAHQDEVPLLVMAGDVKTQSAGRGALQDGGAGGLDIMSMMRPITKYSEALRQPERAGIIARQALNSCMQHPRGPVLLQLPVDVSMRQIPMVSYEQHLPGPMRADDEVCEKIADMLSRAQRPAIFLGLGARTTGAGPAVRKLAERGRIPVFTDVEAKGEFPESHSLSLGMFGVGGGPSAEAYLETGVDLIIFVGTRLDDTTTAGYSDLLGKAQTVVQLDYDPRRLCRSYRADLAVCCEPAGTLERVCELMHTPDIHTVLMRDRAVTDARAADYSFEELRMGETGPFDPSAVVQELQRAFGPNTVFTSDIGNHLLFAARNLVMDTPRRFHVSNGLGGMGSGIGTAMGLASAYRGTRTVVGICGDGGLLMVGNELATCAKYNIPVVLAVFNDGQLGMVNHGFRKQYERPLDCSLPRTDLAAYARSLGVRACRIQRPEDISAAVALIDGPLVLDIPIDPEAAALNPRETTLAFTS